MPLYTSTALPEEIWATAFNGLGQRIRHAFVRPEAYQRAIVYVQGLMGMVARKNGWQVAEAVGEATPYAIQHLLDRAKWDCKEVRDVLCAFVSENLATPEAILEIDETGFLKKGSKSVGVQRQYSGTAGRIENCQIGVFLSYASVRGHTLVDRELYVPKNWTDDPQRCREAHVPDGVTFATKPELAQRMLERTLDAGLPAAWVVGDTVYGSSRLLWMALEERRQAYALAVTCKEQVEVQGVRKRVDQLAQALAREDWQVLSATQSGGRHETCGDGLRVGLRSHRHLSGPDGRGVRSALDRGAVF